MWRAGPCAVDAARCAIEVQNGVVERNSGLPQERRIDFRIGIHLGDVVEESDGDLMGDGVNVAARLEAIAKPGAICLCEDVLSPSERHAGYGGHRSRPDKQAALQLVFAAQYASCCSF